MEKVCVFLLLSSCTMMCSPWFWRKPWFQVLICKVWFSHGLPSDRTRQIEQQIHVVWLNVESGKKLECTRKDPEVEPLFCPKQDFFLCRKKASCYSKPAAPRQGNKTLSYLEEASMTHPPHATSLGMAALALRCCILALVYPSTIFQLLGYSASWSVCCDASLPNKCRRWKQIET